MVVHVVLPVGLTVALFASAFVFIALPTMEESLMSSKQETIRELTDSVWTLVADYERRAREGELTHEEAKRRVLARLEKMRYGPEGKDYYWVNDMHPNMVMHPYRSDLNGKDISTFEDPAGTRLFVDMVDVVKAEGAGYVHYMWQWKDDSEHIVPKVSYVRGFEPWGWIVGTGIYVEDVRDTISELTRKVWITFGIILLIIIALSSYVIRQGVRIEHRRAEAEGSLITAERRQAAIIDFLPDATFVVDQDRKVFAWNKAMEKLTGLTAAEMLGNPHKSASSVFYNHSRHLLIDYIFDPNVGDGGEYRHFAKEGDRYVGEAFLPNIGDRGKYLYAVASPLYDERGKIVGAIESVRDITAKMRLEETLIQSEKMLSVGGLAAGMAHEINNPLAGMLQSTQVIMNRLSETLPRNHAVAAECGTDMETISSYAQRRDIRSLLENISLSGRRAAKIVENMLSFARKSGAAFSTEDMVELVENTIDLASNDYNLKKKYDFRKIKIDRIFPDTHPAVPCEGSKIQQVVLNLLKNAAEAMSEAGTEEPTLKVAVSEDAENVMLQITDNGPGMDEQVRKRVFEPFYTTKEVGTGTGLGLSVSYFIITKNHNGEMSVESELGVGTSFIITLPKSAPTTTASS